MPGVAVFAGLDIQRHHRPGERCHEPGCRELLGGEIAGDLGRLDSSLEHCPVAGRRFQFRQRGFGVFERRELRLNLGHVGRQPIERGLGRLHLEDAAANSASVGWACASLYAAATTLRLLVACWSSKLSNLAPTSGAPLILS